MRSINTRYSVRTALSTGLLLSSCGSHDHAKVVDPSYPDPCRFFPLNSCSDNGECHPSASGEPECLCAPGYAGVGCDVCEEGFHLDARSLCVTDRSCAEQGGEVCSSVGVCQDDEGVISCACDHGYGGPRCTLCANGYARASASAACTPDTRGQQGLRDPDDSAAEMPDPTAPAPPPAPCSGAACMQCTQGVSNANGQCAEGPSCVTTVTFEEGDGYATVDNTCAAIGELAVPQLSLHSRAGDAHDPGYVWQCANFSPKFGLATRHVELEAGPSETAELIFPTSIRSIRFDVSGTLSALSVDVLADGAAVGRLEHDQYVPTEFALDLPSPTMRVALRSRTVFVQYVAIDNVSYRATDCE